MLMKLAWFTQVKVGTKQHQPNKNLYESLVPAENSFIHVMLDKSPFVQSDGVVLERYLGSVASRLRLSSQARHLAGSVPRAQCPSFLICKMRIITASTSRCCQRLVIVNDAREYNIERETVNFCF